MALTQVRVPYVENYDLGVGVDIGSMSPMGKAVAGEASGVEGVEGSTVSFAIERVYSTTEMSSKMGISVKAGGGCGVFSASARFDFATSCAVQSSSLFLCAHAQISLKNLSIDDPTLSPAALEIVHDADAFGARFGNMFVRGLERGGLCMGVIRVNTDSEEESQKISMALSGSYGPFSAEAKANFEKATRNTKSKIDVSVYHEGGPEGLVVNDPTDPMEILRLMNEFLKSFQDDPEKNAVPYNVTLAPMVIANGPVPANSADIQHAQDVLSICATARADILDQLNLMNYIIKYESRFDFPPPTTTADVATAIKNFELDLDIVSKAASRSMNDASKAVTPAELAVELGRVYPTGMPPSPAPARKKGELTALATKGQGLITGDSLITAIRDAQAEGPTRRGFEIGIGTMNENSAWGPGSREILDSLQPEEQPGFTLGAEVCRQRNINSEVAGKGARVTAADPEVQRARALKPPGLYWLGFDIATGLFGNPKLGALGNTVMGPGSQAIRASLTVETAKGFDDGVAYHLAHKYL